MANKVWVLGDAVIDLFTDEMQRLLPCPGGAPANVAVGIARLNGNSAFIGRVGDEPFGHRLQQVLQQERVDTAFLHYDTRHRTSVVLVSLNDDGERQFTFMVRPSADLFLETGDLPPFSAGEWLHCCSIALAAEPSRSTTLQAIREVRRAGGWLSFDANLRDDLWPDRTMMLSCVQQALAQADVVKLSDDELKQLTGMDDITRAIDALSADINPALLVVTQGKAGAWAGKPGSMSFYAAQAIRAVDTTGAGDAFMAGLLAGLSGLGDNWRDSDALPAMMAQAQACGALATTSKGAMTALPHREALADYLSVMEMSPHC
ncbi:MULTISPECIES: aminoimidazole riboside kinase [unclassified Brenneria]|uniref:aminoimidazole riboside kinase n=1 Tax=unclassified Brenneria TaxID=2634434 RepID=UPI001552B3E3|nr:MULTISPECIES: aminoimidazole riboside kinase [unclassified Brenneria]MBJ7220964.1 aminoimidazole riboside kinase [Brenneria sp. L3-3C-1]MEE3642205.1 aminoimidazole riboside kinase [Brenneria sp. L3_3C_1]MEE3650423.1 aminoimidazole riboside kinase [Brenneria sp. HEZEL_4_2_4]NPD00379.1 aminoimidazole riboside kinase [Brenneria sp. hezel4-2-4]